MRETPLKEETLTGVYTWMWRTYESYGGARDAITRMRKCGWFICDAYPYPHEGGFLVMAVKEATRVAG
jgi:hypothetical protein